MLGSTGVETRFLADSRTKSDFSLQKPGFSVPPEYLRFWISRIQVPDRVWEWDRLAP